MNPNAEYLALRTRWDRDSARAAYDATPPCRFALAFWCAVAAKLQRTQAATYKQLHVFWGWPPKCAAQAKPTCGCGRPRLRRNRECWLCRRSVRYKLQRQEKWRRPWGRG